MEITREAAITMLEDDETIDNHIDIQKCAQEIDERSIKAELWARERRDIIEMRAGWSKWILYSIISVIIFDMLITLLLGFQVIFFTSEWIVPAFVTDSIIKVIGLAYIVVNFLFHKDSIDNSK
ncbi:MAG: hypothetical protein HYV41_02820 [Candidatus Magasanikbacteria bacterium]|nr:hypothetical protein [Candidatus Magasanikbacteria bacterium]